MTITVVPSPAHLSWNDFAAVAVLPDSNEDAQVSSQAVLPDQVGMTRVNGKFKLADFTLTVSTEPTETLVVRSAQQTGELLEHEQGHFDLMVLSARVLAAELERLAADSPQELQRAVKAVLATHRARAKTIDRKYDTQTDHSRNTAQQRRWRKLIDEALQNGSATQIDGNNL